MNSESIFAVALILAVCLAPTRKVTADTVPFGRPDWLSLAGVCFFVAVAAWPTLWIGFVADDYSHILTVSKANASFLWDLFTIPAADRFFRPLGMISYWIDLQWAGFSPVRWHLAGLLLHTVNTALAYVFCRKAGLGRVWALFAAALFGVHGTRPEAMTWVAARFDLVATLFVLLTMLVFQAYVRRPSPARLLLLLFWALCGLLSKESAYILPFLMAGLLAFQRDLRSAGAYKGVAACTALTTAVFLYRWLLLRGIGGYLDTEGRPTILLLNVWLTAKALALRLWAVLLFPLNWTDPLGLPVKISLFLAAGALIVTGLRAKRTGSVGMGLVFVFLAAIPVQHLLLIGPDLEKSRVVYLSSVGFALFMAAVLQMNPRAIAYPAAVVLLSFQVAALRHNLATWDRVSRVHARACDEIARAAGESLTNVVAVGMPNTYDGVYMLKTGLPECLEVRHGIPAKRLHNVGTMEEAEKLGGHGPLFVWNAEKEGVQRIR